MDSSITIISPAAFVVALLVATLGHELGHLLVAYWVGIPVRLIAIGLGPALWRRSASDGVQLVLRALPTGMSVGVPGRRDEAGHLRRPIRHDLLMAAGGPVASFLFSGLLLGLAAFLGPASFLFNWLVMTAILSTLLALLNLLPVPGLDGGHLLVLAVAGLGYQLSPQQEATLHRKGLWILVCIVGIVALIRMAGIL